MKYSKNYIPDTLSKKDKVKQKKQLDKSVSDYKKGILSKRDKLKSFKSKPSGYVNQVKSILKLPMNLNKIADKLTKTDKREKELKKGLEQILKKGKAAYFSSGSRPNQTPFSWGKARVASVLVGGASRRIDKDIVKKFKIPNIKK